MVPHCRKYRFFMNFDTFGPYFWKNCRFQQGLENCLFLAFFAIFYFNFSFNDAYWFWNFEKWSTKFWKFSENYENPKIAYNSLYLAVFGYFAKIPSSKAKIVGNFRQFFTIFRFSKFLNLKNRGSESGQMTAFSHFISEWNKNLPF